MYHGETAQNLYTRSKEHYNAFNNKSEKSFMHKHVEKEHGDNDENITFSWKVIGQFRKPLARQLCEAVHIDNKSAESNLNSKAEYYRHSTKRITIQSDELNHQCGFCSKLLKH